MSEAKNRATLTDSELWGEGPGAPWGSPLSPLCGQGWCDGLHSAEVSNVQHCTGPRKKISVFLCVCVCVCMCVCIWRLVGWRRCSHLQWTDVKGEKNTKRPSQAESRDVAGGGCGCSHRHHGNTTAAELHPALPMRCCPALWGQQEGLGWGSTLGSHHICVVWCVFRSCPCVTAPHSDALVVGPWDDGDGVFPTCPCQLLQADGFLCFLTCQWPWHPATSAWQRQGKLLPRQVAFCPSAGRGAPSGEACMVKSQECVFPEHRTPPGSAPPANSLQQAGAQRGLLRFPVCLVLLSCMFPEGRAGPTTTCCLLPFLRALMHLMMNSQAFEKALCFPETTTKYYKLKIAASIWNMPTSPTEHPVECKFASICIHIHNFHFTHQPCSIKMQCLTLWADDGVWHRPALTRLLSATAPTLIRHGLVTVPSPQFLPASLPGDPGTKLPSPSTMRTLSHLKK